MARTSSVESSSSVLRGPAEIVREGYETVKKLGRAAERPVAVAEQHGDAVRSLVDHHQVEVPVGVEVGSEERARAAGGDDRGGGGEVPGAVPDEDGQGVGPLVH